MPSITPHYTTLHHITLIPRRNIFHFIKQKANWTGHILRRNCLLQQVIEGKIKGLIEVTRRRGRRRKKLLDDLKDRRGYCQLKEEALDRTMWRNRFGRGFGPVVWQITDDDDYFTGDEAYPLSEDLMKVYLGQHPKGSKERIFSYRIRRARRVVENVFGLSSSVFRMLRKPTLLEPEKVQLVAMTISCLHNYLRRSPDSAAIYSTVFFDR